jgi:lysophospholipase L1-like esterase
VRDLVLLVVLLLVGEIAVRVLFPQTRRHLFTDTITGGHPIHLNAYRLRDVEFPALRPPHERRILCVGDSTTFGAGLAAEDTYPKQLEQLLRARAPGAHWRVINGGGQAASVSKLIHFLQTRGLPFGPELVVLGFSPTMLSVAGRTPTAEAVRAEAAGERVVSVTEALWRAAFSVHIALQRSYLYIAFDTHVRRQLYRLGVLRDRMDKREGATFAYAFDVPGLEQAEVERAYSVFREELRALKQMLDDAHVSLVILEIPSRFRISTLGVDNERGYDLSKIRVEPMKRVASTAADLGIPFVDLQPILSRQRRAMLDGTQAWNDLYVPMDYAHLNRAGMRVAAETLLRTLNLDGRGP